MCDEKRHRDQWIKILEAEFRKRQRVGHVDYHYKPVRSIFAHETVLLAILEDLRVRSAKEAFPPLECLPSAFRIFRRLGTVIKMWEADRQGGASAAKAGTDSLPAKRSFPEVDGASDAKAEANPLPAKLSYPKADGQGGAPSAEVAVVPLPAKLSENPGPSGSKGAQDAVDTIDLTGDD